MPDLLTNIINKHITERGNYVYVSRQVIRRIAKEFSLRGQCPRCKVLFAKGYRRDYTERSDQEYNAVMLRNWERYVAPPGQHHQRERLPSGLEYPDMETLEIVEPERVVDREV